MGPSKLYRTGPPCHDGHRDYWVGNGSGRYSVSVDLARLFTGTRLQFPLTSLLARSATPSRRSYDRRMLRSVVIWRSSTGRNRFSRSAIALITLLFMQVVIGMMNVLFLAPVWLQITHLFVADVLWVLLVLASADLVLEAAKKGRKT